MAWRGDSAGHRAAALKRGSGSMRARLTRWRLNNLYKRARLIKKHGKNSKQVRNMSLTKFPKKGI